MAELLDIEFPNESHFSLTKLSENAKTALRTWPREPRGKQNIQNYIELLFSIYAENEYRSQKIAVPTELFLFLFDSKYWPKQH